MTWHLKDRKLENALDYFTKGQFSKKLNQTLVLRSIYEDVFTSPSNFNLEIDIAPDDVEELPEYNPGNWNEYPKVMPPERVMMRVEYKDGRGTKAYFSINSEGEACWYTATGLPFFTADGDPVRFRPWED